MVNRQDKDNNSDVTTMESAVTPFPKIEAVIVPKKSCKETLMENILMLLTVVSVLAGIGLGLSLRSQWSPEDYRKLFYLEFPGRILMNMILMLIIPMTVSGLVTGMTNMGTLQSKNLGTLAIAYYTLTTFMAAVIGIVLVVIVRPGSSGDTTPKKARLSNNRKIIDSLLDVVSQCFPTNLITACFQKEVTVINLKVSERRNQSGDNNFTVLLEKPEIGIQKGTNVLGLVVFSVALGIAINHVGDKGKAMKDFFESLNTVTMALMDVILLYLPFGVMCLVATQFIAAKDIWVILSGLGKFMAVVTVGLAIHGCLVLPLIYFVFTRKNPLTLANNTTRAMVTAFSTSSSNATLPVTMECLINNCSISIDVVRFLIPVGAVINMDGTALYEAVAAIYIAQFNRWDLGLVELCIVSVTSTAAAVGAAGIPQAGLGTLVIVLTAVGLPIEDALILLSVDWLMDRLRTMVNVWGDCVGAAILDHRIRKDKADKLAQQLAEDTLTEMAQVNEHAAVSGTQMSAEDTMSGMQALATNTGVQLNTATYIR